MVSYNHNMDKNSHTQNKHSSNTQKVVSQAGFEPATLSRSSFGVASHSARHQFGFGWFIMVLKIASKNYTFSLYVFALFGVEANTQRVLEFLSVF